MALGSVSAAFLVTACVFSSLRGISGYSHSEMQEVKEQLQILTNEVSRLADASSKSDQAQAQSPPGEPVTLVSVERNETSLGNVFFLNFTKNFQQVYYTVEANGEETVSFTEVGGGDGTSSLTFTCQDQCNRANSVFVTFTNIDESSKIRLKLDNSNYRAAVQGDFTVPELEIEHSGDLVYDASRDVDVKVSASYGVGRNHRYSDVSPYIKMVYPDGWSFGKERSYDLIKISDQTKYLKSQETTFTVETSHHSVRGFFVLALTFSDSEAPLVKEFEVQRSLIIRLRDQQGPFDDGFLTFPEFEYRKPHFSTQTTCRNGENCSLSCSAVGGSMTDLQVNKLQAGGEKETVEDASYLVMTYYRRAEWTFQSTNDSEDATFECMALTASTNLTRIIEVKVMSEEFYIDENRTGMEVTTDETNPEMKNVTLTCTVVGQPVTEIYFSFEITMLGYTYMEYLTPDSELESLDSGATRATATIYLGDVYTADMIGGITCHASRAPYQYQYREYEIRRPNEPL